MESWSEACQVGDKGIAYTVSVANLVFPSLKYVFVRVSLGNFKGLAYPVAKETIPQFQSVRDKINTASASSTDIIMNLNDSIMHDAEIIMTPIPTTIMASPQPRRYGRYRDHLAQQPRSVSLRDFGCQKDDTPATPPSESKRHPLLSSHPPEVPRHERPINRRLLLQEAQDRLSLPDLFAPRTPAPARRRVRALPQRPSLMPIQPRMEPWSECYEEGVQSHSMSQRSFFSHINPADF